jgi:DNA polymerase-3 subunit alpha
MEADPRYTELFQLARKLEGLKRQSSLHAAGVVIGKRNLDELVPLFCDKSGGIATEYTMTYLEQCGLVKMDFLGLKTLDILKNCEELIQRRGGEYASFKVDEIPDRDEPTFKMIGEGKSFRIFQFESGGMQDMLKQAHPASIEDLTALNAMYRPGPMQFMQQFIDCKNGKRAIEYPDPSLAPVLKETYGVIVYQEQVMQVAQIIAGYSLGQADLLRRAMGKKKKDVMAAEKEKFIDGAVKRGYTKEKANEIFDILVPFAGYGFNKSHAAAYSVVAYRTAWLKCHFPAEFMAANLTNDANAADKDALPECTDEVRKMGIPLDPPDVNRSEKYFSVSDTDTDHPRVVFGFLGIKGVGEAPADEIIRCRQEGGPYKDFMEFLQRVDIKSASKKAIELLILTGAFDKIAGPGQTREVLQGNLERAVEFVQKGKEDKSSGQGSLFGDPELSPPEAFTFEPFPSQSRLEKLNTEKQLIGFYFSGHPMDEYKDLWKRAVKVDLGKPETLKPGACILLGLVKTLKAHTTSKGGKMAFVTLGDYNGDIDATFFPGAWERCQDEVAEGKIVALRGKIEFQKGGDTPSFLADELIRMKDLESVIAEEEERAKRWDKYRNIWRYPEVAEPSVLCLGEAAAVAAKLPPIRDMKDFVNKKLHSFTVVGLLSELRPHQTKNGDDMAFGALQDEGGTIDLVFFPRTWKNCKDILIEGEMVAFRGSLEGPSEMRKKCSFQVSSVQDINKLVKAAAKEDEENISHKGTEARREEQESVNTSDDNTTHSSAPLRGSLDNAVDGSSGADGLTTPSYTAIHIRLNADDAGAEQSLTPIRDCLYESSGHCRVFIHVPIKDGEAIVQTAVSLSVGAGCMDQLKACKAAAEVWGE